MTKFGKLWLRIDRRILSRKNICTVISRNISRRANYVWIVVKPDRGITASTGTGIKRIRRGRLSATRRHVNHRASSRVWWKSTVAFASSIPTRDDDDSLALLLRFPVFPAEDTQWRLYPRKKGGGGLSVGVSRWPEVSVRCGGDRVSARGRRGERRNLYSISDRPRKLALVVAAPPVVCGRRSTTRSKTRARHCPGSGSDPGSVPLRDCPGTTA